MEKVSQYGANIKSSHIRNEKQSISKVLRALEEAAAFKMHKD